MTREDNRVILRNLNRENGKKIVKDIAAMETDIAWSVVTDIKSKVFQSLHRFEKKNKLNKVPYLTKIVKTNICS